MSKPADRARLSEGRKQSYSLANGSVEKRTHPNPPNPNPGDRRTQPPNPGDRRTQPPNPGDKRTQPPNPGDKRTQPPNPGDRRTQPPNPGDRRTQPPNPGDKRTQPSNPGDRRAQPSPSHHWRSYKLVVDPALKKGQHKVYRYDGQTFSMPNCGMLPLDSVRDPRIGRLWTKYKETDLPVPTFKIDECYVGRVPPKEVTFARLNDNIREPFLSEMCKKYGDIEEVEILYNPKNKKHLGIAKVVFEKVKAAKLAVETLHNTSVMGNIIHVELDPKGENRLRYFQLLMNGSYTPWTLPVGMDDAGDLSPHNLTEALMSCEATRRLSEGSVASTPLSMDTAYCSLRQETPQSQGTPHTPRQPATPFSQDSSYSSRPPTPAYQPARATRRHDGGKFQDAYNRRPERPQYRSTPYRGTPPSSSEPAPRPQATPPEPPSAASPFGYKPPPAAAAGFKSSFSSYQAPPSFTPAEPSFPPPGQRDLRPPRPPEDRPETPPVPEPPPEPGPPPATPPPRTPERCPSPGTPARDAERNSLDSRIEMLLKEKRTKLPFLAERDSDPEVQMDGSPVSSSSSQLSPVAAYGAPPPAGQRTARPSSTGLEDVSPTPLPESEDEEPAPGTLHPRVASLHPRVASLHPRVASPPPDQSKDLKGGPFGSHTPTENTHLGSNSSGEDMEISEDEAGSSPLSSSALAKGIVVNSAVSPMHQTLGMAPHGFPPLPHQAAFLPHPHLAGVPPPMLQHMAPYPPGMVPIVQVELMSCLPQWGSVHMSFQMQTQMLSRMSQTGGGPFPYPHFMGGGASAPFGGPYTPVTMGATPAGSPGQPWPQPGIPTFNPAVPPPGYEDQKEDPHKATVDGVLLVIVKELKAIMKRDLNRKMVEVVAFRAFDDWWDKKERSAKASLTPVKPGEGKDDEQRVKAKEAQSSSLLETWTKGEVLGYDSMGMGMGLRGAIRLPSFKVKRKPDQLSSADSKRPRPSTPDELEDEERDRDPAELPLEDKMDPDGSASKRRHSRPLELDSEGEEQRDASEKEEEGDAKTVPCSSDKETSEEEEEEEEEEAESSSESDTTDSSDDEVESSATSAVGYDSSAASRDSSSDYESSSGEEEEDEEQEELVADVEDGDEDAQAVSSSSSSCSSSSSSSEDEEEVEERPSPPPVGSQEEEVRRPPSPPEVRPLPGGPDLLKPPSPKQPAAKQTEALAPQEYVLRPPTPTGSLSESDNDIQGKTQEEGLPLKTDPPSPKPPPASLLHLPLPPPPAPEVRPPSLPHPRWPRSSTDEEDVPRTPGREPPPRGPLKSQSAESVPVTPGRDTPLTGSGLLSPFPYPAQSPVLGPGVPRTPGRDLTFTPVFPELALHRKQSLEGPAPRPLFKEPSVGPPGEGEESAQLWDPTPARFGLEVGVARDSAPAGLEVGVARDPAPAGLGLEMGMARDSAPSGLEVGVARDPVPSRRKPGRPKGKKFPADASPAEPPDSSAPEGPALARYAEGPVTEAVSPEGSEGPEALDQRRLDFREDKASRRDVAPAGPTVRRPRRRWEELLLVGLSPVATPTRPSFALRSDFEEVTILYDIWNDGIDDEDIRLLQVTYDAMLQQDTCSDWLNDTLWVNHPPTNIPGVKRKRRDDGMRDHMTGCARSEGYYKIDKKDKIKYLQSTRLLSEEPPTDTQGMSIPAQVHASTRAGSERRSEQRRLLSSFACDSDLLKFNQLKFRKKKIRFCRSGIHDWGLFALEPIAADEMVIEYVGQNIRQVIADMREKRYEDEGIGSSYMFRVDHDTIIDATKCGNFARFINHSCNPNCYAKVITVESQKKIVIYSRQPINVNEEITYDYKFPIEDEKIPCLCGAENCRGTLN